MRLGMFMALATAVLLAGCSSSRGSTDRVARAPALEPMAPLAVTTRTQTVTARPVAKTLGEEATAQRFMPPPAPPISEASTRPVGTLRPAGRRAIETAINPASRPARTPALATSAKPIAPVCAPSFDEACPGGVCGIPDPCDPCPGGNCGIPSPCDVINFLKKRK